jgi:hypothetical protein
MKLEFFKRLAAEQALSVSETAARRNLSSVMVEKDFWVSWILGVLFGHPEFRNQLVFKGGTSLSKVFGVINRFSEDIDLSVGPAFLGISEQSIEAVGSRRQAEARMNELENACIERVELRFLPELERIASEALGTRPDGPWMGFSVDATTHSPVVSFHYPFNEATGFEYLKRSVKMEFGSLTDQKPVGVHGITSWVAEEFPQQLADFRCQLVALELEGTFWEKATILHMEYHREKTKPIRDRFSRHYSDMAALATHPVAASSLARPDLRKRVVDWKSRFFPAAWARYDLASPGSFRLAPPAFRFDELRNDYEAMEDMFIVQPPSFETVIEQVVSLEERINNPEG